MPALSRITTEIHARYVLPIPPYDGRGAFYTYPHGHSLLLFGLKAESCEVSRSRKQRFNKRLLLCHPI